MQIGTLREWVGYSVVFVVLLLIVPPFFTNADGSAADAMCAKANPECPCAQVKNQQTGQCEKKSVSENPYECPMYCKDDTNGHKTVGHCTAPNKCKGDTCDGKPCEQDKDGKPPEMPKPPESKDSPPPPSSPCKAKGADGQATTSTQSVAGASPDSSPPCDAGQMVDSVSSSTFDVQMTDGDSTSTASTTSNQQSALETYIETLRGYFNGANGAVGNVFPANSQDYNALESVFRELGLNANLGDSRQWTSPWGVSPGASGIYGGAGATGQLHYATDTSAFSESPATGFLAPRVTHPEESSGLFKRTWDLIKSLFRI